MGIIRDTANAAYSDGATSNPDEPDKAPIRRLFGLIEDTFSGLPQGYSVNYETRAELYGDLDWPPGVLGRVFGDSNTTYRGVYLKLGAFGSGSWTRIGPLPGGDTTAIQAQVDALETEVDGKLDNSTATARLLGRVASGAGAVEQLTSAQVRALLNVEDGADVTDKENVAAALAASSAKPAVVDADTVAILDSEASSVLKRSNFGAVKAWIKSWIVKADVGLGRVDNTADIDKDLSLRTKAAISARGPSHRDELIPGMAWNVIDALGRYAGIDLDGYLRASGVKIYNATERDNMGPYALAFMDVAKRVAMGITKDGATMIANVLIPVPAGRDFISEQVPIIVDKAGRMLMGIHPAGLALVGPGLSTYRAPTELKGGYSAINVRMAPEHMVGTVQFEGGYVCDVAQRLVGNDYNAAVAIDDGPIRGVLVIGQSNAGAGSGPVGALPVAEPLAPHHSFITEGAYAAYGTTNSTTSLNGYDDIQAAKSFSNQAYAPSAAMGGALANLDIAAWRRAPAYVFFTAWEGSQPISSFLPATAGHYNHANALAGIRAMLRCGDNYRETELTAMLFIQGENGSVDYATSLGDYIDDVVPLYADQGGIEALPFLFRQINLAQNASAADTYHVELDQLAVARARLGDGVTMTGPMYHLPLHDTIHADNLGRLIGGEMDAVAYRSAVELGETFHPLWPVAGGVTRTGNTITVPMSLPPGLPSSALDIDADWVATVPNAGFVYSDASSGATITNVAISGTNIVITLSANPGAAANKLLSYAIYSATPVAGWAGGRGLIYSDTGIESPAHRKGLSVPETIRHYCVRFQESLT